VTPFSYIYRAYGLREAEARLAEPRVPAAAPLPGPLPGPLLAPLLAPQWPVQPQEMAYCCLEEG
jgi:hypothetical protein